LQFLSKKEKSLPFKGIFRIRALVAGKIALASAGTKAERPGSPAFLSGLTWRHDL
jgi:hypothetical protein